MNEEKLFAETVAYSAELVGLHSERNKAALGYEDMYLMHKTEFDKTLEKISTDVVLTKSTDERVAIQAVLRLLATTIPKVKMPTEKNDVSGQDKADKIERLGAALFASSDRVTRKPAHYNATLCGALYDEIQVEVECTQDMLDALDEDTRERKKADLPPVTEYARKRIERIAKTSPYIFHIENPRGGYPIWDNYGIQAMLKVKNVTLGSVLDHYGATAYRILGAQHQELGTVRMNPVTLNSYEDGQYRCIWMEEYAQPLLIAEHGLPFLRWACVTAEGSDIFDKPEDQRTPFLYTVYKSHLDERKTEALTALFTANRVKGFSPLMVFTKGADSDSVPTEQRLGLFKYIEVPPGAKWEERPHVTDPATADGLNIADAKTEGATIFKSVLGQSQSDTFSQTALLSQLGRIPLETIKDMTGRVLADALEIAMQWIKHNGRGVKVKDYRSGVLAEIKPKEIPDYINLDVKLNVSLPQDKLQAATIAKTLLDVGIVSKEWIQENVLDIDQSKQMTKDIWKERASELRYAQMLEQMMAAEQQPQQPVPQAQEQPGAVPGIPPEMMAGGMGGPEMPMQEQMPGEEMAGLA
jgi:hypothetical protein